MTDQEIVALFDDKIGPPAFEFADKRIVAFANALLRKKEEEIVELHARLAGANLRADIGWSRYEKANTARINAEKCLSQTWDALLSRAIPEGHVVVPKEPTQEMCAAGYYTHGTPCAPEIIYRAMIAAAAPANKEG